MGSAPGGAVGIITQVVDVEMHGLLLGQFLGYVGAGVVGAGVAGRHTPHDECERQSVESQLLIAPVTGLQPHEMGMHWVDCATRVQTEPLGHGSDDELPPYRVHRWYDHWEVPVCVQARGAGGAGLGGGVGPKLEPHSTASVKVPVEEELYPSTLIR